MKILVTESQLKRVINEHKKRPVVINGHTLALWDGVSDTAEPLSSSVIKGSPISSPLSAMEPILVTGKHVRYATKDDFNEFRHHHEGYFEDEPIGLENIKVIQK